VARAAARPVVAHLPGGALLADAPLVYAHAVVAHGATGALELRRAARVDAAPAVAHLPVRAHRALVDHPIAAVIEAVAGLEAAGVHLLAAQRARLVALGEAV